LISSNHEAVLFVVGNARDERILLGVIVLVGLQIIAIQSLFDTSHIAIHFKLIIDL